MPFVRGRILGEIELAGPPKRFLDILLWTDNVTTEDLKALDELEILRNYLDWITPFVCQIRLWAPDNQPKVIQSLQAAGIQCLVIVPENASEKVKDGLKGAEPELAEAVATSLKIDADCLVTNRTDWLPFVEEVEKFSLLLTDCGFLHPYSEIFVRGHDLPWAFRYKVWNEPWMAFYQLSERRTFEPGLQLLHKAFQKKAPAEALETGRSLVYNRIGNLCFTRDRLLFYEIQRLVSNRRRWKRQKFGFEIAYYLNFNYLLIYGAFDHAALFVNQLLNLGLPPRQVGATYKGFLDLLQKSSPSLNAIFTQDPNKAFIDRIGSLRHFAAHRGSLQPTTVVEALDHEPTIEELDADIKAAGDEEIINMLPEGESREGFREMARTNARWARYEKGKVLEDVVPIELDGKFGFIKPQLDTTWNFARVMTFLNAVFQECSKLL
jgi:hypothetical protein